MGFCACSRQSREWSSLKVALRKALAPSGVVFALFDGVLLRKRFQVGFCEPADRFVAPSHRVCYSGEHIVGFRTDQSCVRKQKNNADQILPSGGKVVLLLCHPLGFLRVLTVRVGWGV